LSIGAESAKKCCCPFFDPSHLFILLNFDYLDVYGSLVWGFSFCVEMLDDDAIVAVVGAIFPSAGPTEREREI
jgi:hypothetical protein